MPAQTFGEVLAELGQHFQIALTNRGRIEHEEILALLKILKAGPAREREVDLVAVEELEGHQLVALFAQHTHGFQQRGHVIEQVRDQDDQAASLQSSGERLQHTGQARFLARHGLHHALQQVMEMRDAGAVRNELPHLRVEGDQACRVLLTHQEVSQ